jgi:hypothetical protein
VTLQQAAAQRHKTQNTKHKTRMDAAAGIVVLGEGPPRSDVDVDPDEALERYAYWMPILLAVMPAVLFLLGTALFVVSAAVIRREWTSLRRAAEAATSGRTR